MGTVPITLVGKIEFFEEHIPIWGADPTAIGLTLAQLTELGLRTDAARTSYENARAARTAAHAATLTQKQDIDSMYNLGADMIKMIRAFAEANDDPSVYATAQIPPPSPPAPLGPPQTPKNVQGVLNSAGNIELEWGGSRAGGTSFLIERSINSSGGPWTLIGTSEERSFIDTAVPTSIETASYRITAVRSGGSSLPTNPFTILFGTSGESEGEGLSLAA